MIFSSKKTLVNYYFFKNEFSTENNSKVTIVFYWDFHFGQDGTNLD